MKQVFTGRVRWVKRLQQVICKMYRACYVSTVLSFKVAVVLTVSTLAHAASLNQFRAGIPFSFERNLGQSPAEFTYVLTGKIRVSHAQVSSVTTRCRTKLRHD